MHPGHWPCRLTLHFCEHATFSHSSLPARPQVQSTPDPAMQAQDHLARRPQGSSAGESGQHPGHWRASHSASGMSGGRAKR